MRRSARARFLCRSGHDIHVIMLVDVSIMVCRALLLDNSVVFLPQFVVLPRTSGDSQPTLNKNVFYLHLFKVSTINALNISRQFCTACLLSVPFVHLKGSELLERGENPSCQIVYLPTLTQTLLARDSRSASMLSDRKSVV